MQRSSLHAYATQTKELGRVQKHYRPEEVRGGGERAFEEVRFHLGAQKCE